MPPATNGTALVLKAAQFAAQKHRDQRRRESHWMWFIFPQMAGLGFSPMARKFGIASETEARSYLQHAVPGPRLRECTELLLDGDPALPG